LFSNDVVNLSTQVEILYESDQLFSELKKIGQYIPLSTFLEILKLKLDGKFEILRVKNKVVKPKVEGETIDVVYTRLRKHQVFNDVNLIESLDFSNDFVLFVNFWCLNDLYFVII